MKLSSWESTYRIYEEIADYLNRCYPHDEHVRSDCNFPVKIQSMIQLQEEGAVSELPEVNYEKILFDTRSQLYSTKLCFSKSPEWRWSTSRAAIKNSWASCCSYPARCFTCVHTKFKKRCGLYGVTSPL